ncbi:MAG: putative lipid II flippase FtsW, partial [Actinomycetota bacterium]
MTVVELAKTRIWQRARATARSGAGTGTRTYYLMTLIAGILLVFGLVMILSASSVSAYTRYGSSFLFFQRQVVWAVIGVAAMLIVSRIDYHRWRSLGWLLLLATIAGLVLVLHPSFGTRVGGSSRWLGFGAVRIQPSEIAKLALLLVAADIAVRKNGRLTTLREIILPLGVIVALITGLILLQPDLGTALVTVAIVFIVVFVAGVPMRLLGGLGLVGGIGALGMALAEGYRRARLFSFLNPFRDPLNSGYQSVQSLIALGSGGFFGVGLGRSRQKWLYVPNAHTDFIYAILGEEVGLVGTMAVIGLFIGFAYVGVRTARRAPDAFGRLVAIGITTWIVGQAIVNMGAVTGLLPITGVPLPLVSFGGSALVVSLIAIGILANIARQEQWPPPGSPNAKAPKPRRSVRVATQRADRSRAATRAPATGRPSA